MGSGASSVEQQTNAVMDLLVVEPAIKAPLDPGFAPVVLAKRKYREAAKDCADSLFFALPRSDGGCARGELKVFPESHKCYQASVILAGVMIQETIWRCGASELQLAGPAAICETLKKAYSAGGTYAFEAATMPKANGQADKVFEVKIVAGADKMPEAKDIPQECGKDANGCRLAFDLGKSDIKTVAIKDGEVLDSKETEWDVTNVDPQYHFDAIVAAMKG